MRDSRVIANRFLELAEAKGDTLTPMQLLKLVYIAHGWMLGLYGRPLIRDDVQAWQYGPVIPRLYSSIRQFRSNPVVGPVANVREDLDVSEESIIRQTFEGYGDMSGPALSRMTHAKNTPWDVTYEPGTFGCPISNDIIENHYKALAAR